MTQCLVQNGREMCDDVRFRKHIRTVTVMFGLSELAILKGG